MEYNQIEIKNVKSGETKIYTIKEISWVRDMQITNECLNADHQSVNQTELWIRRLQEATGEEDTTLRNMDRRTFEMLVLKWIEINDVDRAAFLGPKITE